MILNAKNFNDKKNLKYLNDNHNNHFFIEVRRTNDLKTGFPKRILKKAFLTSFTGGFMTTIQKNIPTITNDDIIDTLGATAYEELMSTKKENFVKEKHTPKISQLKNGNWRTYVGSPRRQVARKNYKDLIDYLYDYYTGNQIIYTFQKVFELSCEYRKNEIGLSPNTIDRDIQVYKRFIPDSFSKTPIANITDKTLRLFILKQVKALHPKEKALKSFLGILRAVFKYAYNEHLISSNPCERIDANMYYKYCDMTLSAEEKYFTEEEVKAIQKYELSLLDTEPYQPLVFATLLSSMTALRIGEIPPLKWSDIHDDMLHINKQLVINRETREPMELPYTKNERRHPRDGRYFPIAGDISILLDRIYHLQKTYGIESEYIFCRMDGKCINSNQLQHHLRKSCKKLGLTVTNNHAFRKALNTNVFIANGIPVTKRAKLLGHSVETNERYYSCARYDDMNDIRELFETLSLQNSQNDSHSQSLKNVVEFRQRKTPAKSYSARV